MSTISTRKHPDYLNQSAVWERSMNAYSGGEQYLSTALIKHVSEIQMEFDERLRRAYYLNYPRNIAQRITQYALSVDPKRENAMPELVEDFDRSGLRANEVMRQVSTMLNIYGRAWIFVGAPAFDGEANKARVKSERLRPFAKAISPLSVPDWAYGNDGKLQWAIIEEHCVFDDSPDSKREIVTNRRVWERNRWRLIDRSGSVIAEGGNPTGIVPFVSISEPDGYGIDANHWFEDVVRISDAILNNESEAQMNIIKQMFGMLVVSEAFSRGAQKISPAKGGEDSFSAVVARSAALIESPEEKGISRYISPSGAETATIRAENAALRQELYDVVGLAIQSRSKDAQTAESKAWDFQNVTQFMTNRADLLEQAEISAWEIINKWDSSIQIPKITYNRKFAVRDLEKSISGLLQLSNIPGVGIEYQKTIAAAAVELVEAITSIPDVQKNKVLSEIQNMQPAPVIDPGFGVDNDNTINNNDNKEDK